MLVVQLTLECGGYSTLSLRFEARFQILERILYRRFRNTGKGDLSCMLQLPTLSFYNMHEKKWNEKVGGVECRSCLQFS